MKIKNFQKNSTDKRIKWKSGKANEFFSLVKFKLGLTQWKELYKLLNVPKNTFSNWLNEEITTPATIVQKCIELSEIDIKEIEPLIAKVLNANWGYFKANKALQLKHGKRLAEWARKGGRKIVDNELGPFSPNFPKRKKSGWISEGEEKIAEFLYSRGMTAINVELQRKKFAIKSVEMEYISYICFDMFISELSNKIPTYLEFMGYRNKDYFENKLKRLLQAINSDPNFRIIITPYIKFVKKFRNISQVIEIIEYEDWKKLNFVLNALSGPKDCNSSS
ncbi:MAG: hypothetical protein ACE5J7_00305 [Candidatus Aenigmatarchaeota archaeon]